MNIREIKNDLLNDSYFEIEHDSGLRIFVYPKKGYSSTFAMFGTDYGSVDADGIPNGTAHFLEHKLFESDEIDAFKRFAETGASANAYTSFDRTCYLFNCGANFSQNLEILLDFVTHPYFTQETVEKEQGIIGQEIRMYEDSPDWRLLFNLLRAAYANHPVRIDLAGTVESIAEITADTLYDCYNKFYSLSNMVLAVAGNATVEEVLEVADRVLPGKAPKGEHVKRSFDDPYEVVEKYVEQKMSVSMPQFALGYKLRQGEDTGARPTVKESIMTEIILDCLLGTTTEFYNELLSDGYISPNFEAEFFAGPGYKLLLFMGDSKDPKYVADAIKERVIKVQNTGIAKEDFERTRKAHYGLAVKEYNDVQGLASMLVSGYFVHEGIYDDFEIYRTLTLSEINDYLRTRIDAENVSLSVVLPKE